MQGVQLKKAGRAGIRNLQAMASSMTDALVMNGTDGDGQAGTCYSALSLTRMSSADVPSTARRTRRASAPAALGHETVASVVRTTEEGHFLA